MGTSSTGTLTRTTSITMTDVRHVIWRIETDLRVLRAQHGLITADREQDVVHDLQLFIYRNYVQQIEFRFVDTTTQRRRYAVRYSLTRAWSGDEDDEAGGLRYQDLSGTTFGVIITYSSAWSALPEQAKATFRQSLKRAWEPAADVVDAAGAWATDRAYGSGALGAARSVFRSY
jgi:hypothetical protein